MLILTHSLRAQRTALMDKGMPMKIAPTMTPRNIAGPALLFSIDSLTPMVFFF